MKNAPRNGPHLSVQAILTLSTVAGMARGQAPVTPSSSRALRTAPCTQGASYTARDALVLILSLFRLVKTKGGLILMKT